jgi:hypothetical protein
MACHRIWKSSVGKWRLVMKMDADKVGGVKNEKEWESGYA